MSWQCTVKGLATGLAAGLAALATVATGAASAEPKKQHAVSLIGAPKFGPDFKHFDWVDPAAPKGGVVRQWQLGTYDSLNPYTVKGNPAAGVGLIYDQLFVNSPDEPSTEYGLVAEWLSHPDDFSSVTFSIRAIAKFHDGRPITPEDLIFTFEQLKKNDPQYAFYYKNVVKAEKTGEREVTFHFDEKNNRELPLIVGQLPVLPKHYWTGNDSKGEPRDLARTTLELPLGSGPYRIKSVDAGREIVYERVKDWWAKDLPVAKGQWNFDELRFIYFRDRTPAFEAFKVGQIDFWRESSAKQWATAFDFDAAKKGLVVKEAIKLERPAPMQAFVMNLRRAPFQDARVRQAFNHAFDFEWANANLFFDQYKRVGSYFENTELKSTGLPQGRELEILNAVKDQVPPEVFTTEWKNPVGGTPEAQRRNLSEASKLLAAAGYKPKGGVLVDPQGRELTAEFLIVSPDFERVVLPYKQNLDKLGVKASVRLVDSSQYKRRTDTFDFDVVVGNFAQSLSPGNEQRDFWGSAAADREGSRNLMGIKSKPVDTLIDKVIFAKDREELVAATRALDRVLLWSHYLVPQWYSGDDRIARWDMFGQPKKLPTQAVSFLQIWFVDPEKAKALATKRGN